MMHEFDIETDPMGTLVFCISQNKWRGGDGYESEGLANTSKDAFSFKNGELWRHHDEGGHNKFYDDPVISAVGIVSMPGGKIKNWQTASVESNIGPTNVTFKTTLPKEQNTRLSGAKFRKTRSVYYAAILRSGTGAALRNGPRMTGPFMYALFEFDTRARLQLRYLNLGYKISAGHEFI